MSVSDQERRQLLKAATGEARGPWWVEALLMAETWRLPPWEIVEQAPAEWVDRWRALQVARADQQAVAAGEARVIDGRVYRKVRN